MFEIIIIIIIIIITTCFMQGICTYNIQKSVTDALKGIPEEAFQHCYQQWKQRLRRCVAAQGNYFEGDNLQF
jgi:hypothetical protein